LPLAVAIGVLGRHLGDLKEFCPAMVGQAPEAYKHFDAREEGWTKVVLHPNQTR
jgi:threonine dehydrogenase-like Zn-dependent dehydrogenase